MSRLALDSINYQALAATRWPYLIGYANGRISRWQPDEIKRTRDAGQLLALVDVLGTAPREASVLDFERGDVTSPAVVREWARARNQFAGDATVYCQPKNIATVVSGLRGEPCNLWVVDLTSDGEPPFTVPHYPGLPGNVRVIGRQFVFGPRSGGNYDMSIFYDDNWHPEQATRAAHTFAAAAAAAARAELGPYQQASAAAELTDPVTGEIAAAPALHVMTLPEPFGATLPCAWCPNVATCAAAGRCLEPDGAELAPAAAAPPVDQAAAVVDQAAADIAGAALVASTAPDSPTPEAPVSLGLVDVGAELGLGDPAAALAAASASSGPDGGGAAAAGSSAAAAAAAQSPLNHDFIKAALTDVGKVAAMFRAGGWHNAAAELERAAAIAWELGSALKSAGL